MSAKGNLMAAILACALLANLVPLSLVIPAEMCEMPCCATRGPHSAATHCTGTVCHLNPTASKRKEPVKQEPAAEHCHAEPSGTAYSPKTESAVKPVIGDPSPSRPPDHEQPAGPELFQPDSSEPPAAMSGASIAAACPRSCGAVTGYSLNQHRQSEPSVSDVPTSSEGLPRHHSFGFTILSSLLQRQFPPRAPPSISF